MAAVPMKTQHIKVASRPPNKPPGILAALITALIIFNVLPKVSSQDLYWSGNAANPAVAGSGTWVTHSIQCSIFVEYYIDVAAYSNVDE